MVVLIITQVPEEEEACGSVNPLKQWTRKEGNSVPGNNLAAMVDS